MSPDSRAFAPFVPALILRHFREDLAPPTEGSGKSFSAVSLFADIADSTKIMNKLSQIGRLSGPEEMYRILNAYYEPLVSKLKVRGGDVLGFAGDAVLAVWTVENERELGPAVRQATQAALEIQRDLNNMELAPGVRLSLRIYLGAGELSTALVNGRQEYWKVVAYGPPLNQIRAAGSIAKIGKVYLSREACDHLGDGATIEPQPNAGAFVSKLTPIPSLPNPADLPDAAVLPRESLRPFVQKVVQKGIDAGMVDYINQPRIVSVLFVRLGRPEGVSPSWQYIQDAMSLIQDASCRYDGTVSQFIEDDKGLISLLAFGLPLAGHEDYAFRAVEAAVFLQDLSRNRSIPCGIGVSTGLPFCGALGSPGQRTVYTVTGSDVVRGARLMQLARDGEILCDKDTYAAARANTVQHFDMLPRFMLKGYDTPTRVFRIVTGGAILKSVGFGREPERELLRTALDGAAAGRGRTIWLEGEEGSGALALVDEVVERTAGQFKRLGVPDRIAKPPSSPWPAIWTDLLGLRAIHDQLIRQDRIESFFAAKLEMAPLLNDLLGTSLPETSRTRSLSPADRIHARNELLITLVNELSRERPILVILERFHHLEPDSRELAIRLAGLGSRVTVLASAEPALGSNQLRDDAATLIIPLLSLDDATILWLGCERLRADQLGDRLAEILLKQSSGHPERLHRECNRLLASDRLLTDHGLCELAEEPVDPSKRRDRNEAIPLIGRAAECSTIASTLDEVVGGENRAILVEGDSGSGKSRLLVETRRMAEDRAMLVVVGYCASVENSTPYYPWRAICNELLGLTRFVDPNERNTAVLAALDRSASSGTFAPLLNDLLGLTLPQNDVIRQMTGQNRADNLNAAIVELIRALTNGRPTLLVIEDAQWADSASWRLAKLIRERLVPVAMALAVGRMAELPTVEHSQFADAGWSKRIALETLTETDTREFARHHFGTDRISDPLANLIWRRTQGNPLFIEQITGHLMESRFIHIENGLAGLGTYSVEAVEPEIPDTIRGLLTARIDWLPQGQQLTAKVSSVIAPLFPTSALSAIYPEPNTESVVSDHLGTLTQERLLRQERIDRVSLYDFPHPIIQQVCYELLTRPQRQRLHHRAAEWYQADRASSGRMLRLIAHHWGRAGFIDKQVEFLTRAGDAALRDGAFREAVTGFAELIRLSRERFAEKPPADETTRLGHWEYQLGESYFGLGDLPKAGEHFRASLALRGRVNRESTAGLVMDTLHQVFCQLIRRLRPGRRQMATRHDEENREVAATYLRLGRICYFVNDILPGTNAVLRALNLAETAGASSELATSYASVMILSGLLKWHRAARVYARLAESVAREVGLIHNKSVVLSYRCMYHLGQGDWDEIEVLALESLDLAERLKDDSQCGDVQSVLAMAGCFQANYGIAKKWCARMIETAKRSENKMHTAWALNIDGECDFRLGRFVDAETKMKESAAILFGNKDRTEEIRIEGMLAALAVANGDWVAAQKHAEETEAIARLTSSITCSTLEGFAGLAETRIKLAELSPKDPQARKFAKKALVALRNYTKLFRVGQPRLAVHEGRMHVLLASKEKAVRVWREGLQVAKRLKMPFDMALLHDSLAHSLSADAPEQEMHLNSAIQLYEQLGMGFEVKRLRDGK